MKNSIIVLNAKQYSITDEKTGIVNAGVSFHYLEQGAESFEDKANFSFGVAPSKASLPLEKRNAFVKVPGLYEATFIMQPNARGQAVLKITDLVYVKPVQFTEKDK